jgi:hypothetical protein
MRDISTEDLIQTLVIKTGAAERARCVYAIHPTAANAKAVNARSREEKDARRALDAHLRECLRLVKATQHIKMPRSFIALSRRLPARTVAALRTAGITQPETMTMEDLLRVPNIGVQGVACLAMRVYSNPTHPINWPELEK